MRILICEIKQKYADNPTPYPWSWESQFGQNFAFIAPKVLKNIRPMLGKVKQNTDKKTKQSLPWLVHR